MNPISGIEMPTRQTTLICDRSCQDPGGSIYRYKVCALFHYFITSCNIIMLEYLQLEELFRYKIFTCLYLLIFQLGH